jgi:hypothetical protein
MGKTAREVAPVSDFPPKLANYLVESVVEALGYNLRMDPSLLYQERQQLGIGYGQYAALRAISYLGRSSLRRIVADYQSGTRWYDLSESYGTRLSELISWMGDLQRTATVMQGQLRNPSFAPRRTR